MRHFPVSRHLCRSLMVICLLAIAGATGTPSRADAAGEEQESAAPDQGRSLMERGADLFFEGLRREMEPTLEDAARLFSEIGPSLRDFFSQMGPALADIAEQVEDWSLYEMPEILPNGDIVIRRKEPLNEDPPTGAVPEAAPDGSIDL